MGALDGIRVLELAALGPVPFCGMLLGDMGAEVLRIDRPAAPERGVGIDDRSDLRGRNKRSAIVDLKRPEGRAALLDLAARADVLIEGHRPGVAERLGIGPAACHAVNPRLVYGRATGWGQDGPLAPRAGHDINFLALAGALSMIGSPDGGPVPPLNLVGDYGGGALYLAFGVVCALLHARATGQGQVVDAAMIDGVASLMTVMHGLRQVGRLPEGPGQSALGGAAPFYATYRCRCGGWVAVGAIETAFYAALLTGLGLSPADLPTRDTPANWPAIRARFASRFADRTRDEWTARFAGTDACVTPVLSLAEAAADPHATARGMLRPVEGIDHPAPAPRLSATPGDIRRPGSRAGQHTAEALADWGLSADRVAGGLRDGVFGTG